MYLYVLWWISCSILAVSVILSVTSAFVRYKSSRLLSPDKLLLAGVFLSAVILLTPVYLNALEGTQAIKLLRSLLISVQHSIRLFMIDGGYMEFVSNLEGMPGDAVTMYSVLGVILYALAPFLTFGFILSFFKNVTSYRRYIFSHLRVAHIFSELNDKSLALAKSIVAKENRESKIKNARRSLIVFTDIIDVIDEKYYELTEQSRELGAILFRKDLSSVKFTYSIFKRQLNFYIISDNEEEKLRHTKHLMENYAQDNVTVRVFSDSVKSELLLGARAKRVPMVIRVNDAQSLIYHNLDTYGQRLFENARAKNGDVISAVIVGLGKYGTEMMKALLWYCQGCGFGLKINAFDMDELAEEKFRAKCPEIMSKNPAREDGDAKYEISIHAGVDVRTHGFREELTSLSDATYVFVALGDDEANISASVKIRSLYEDINKSLRPDVETVIYNSEIAREMGVTWSRSIRYENPDDDKACDGIRNYKEAPYRIHTIGDLDSFYSVDTVIDSELVQAGREVNSRYARSSGDPREIMIEEMKFLRYEYNYRSSLSKALHERLRRKLTEIGYICIPGTDKPWNERTEDEKLAIGNVEHIRWNAYMRTEGYSYGEVRCDMAKRHNNLVNTNELSDDDLRKDA